MKRIVAFLKQIQLGKILTVFLAATILLVTTACNSGNELGARPDVPPVQMGGQNNPHKAGGDSYTKYKMTTDPKVKDAGGHASLMQNQLVAVGDYTGKRSDGLLYPGSRDAKSADSVDDFVSRKRQQELRDPSLIPAPQQPTINRSDPNAKLLERVGETFKDASQFLNNDETTDRAQPNLNRAVEQK